MTASDRDPILDAFDRRLAAVEPLIPARPPALGPLPDRAPNRVVGGRATRPAGRPAWDRRGPAVLAPLGLAAAVVVALLGVALLARPAAGPGAAGSPTPSAAGAAACPAPAASAAARPVSTTCRYLTATFDPAIAFEVVPGWAIVRETPREVLLQTDLGTLRIAALDHVAVTPCQPSGVAGATRPWTPSPSANGPQALMDWIESDSGVAHSPPSPATIGGHRGLETTLSPGIDSLAACAGVAFLSDLGTPADGLRIRENEAMRLAVIVVGDRTLVVAVQASRAASLGDLAATADGIVTTVTFR